MNDCLKDDLLLHYNRQRNYICTTHILSCVTEYLSAMNSTPFLKVDFPNGFGYRRVPLNTFYYEPVFLNDEDEPGITIPWPPGEAHVVSCIYHLSRFEHMKNEEILLYLKIPSWSIKNIFNILNDSIYQRIGLDIPNPYQENSVKWTLIGNGYDY
jgi:hypothetical protein